MLGRREDEAIQEAYHFTGKHSCIPGRVEATFVYMENASTLWEEMAINTVGKSFASILRVINARVNISRR